MTNNTAMTIDTTTPAPTFRGKWAALATQMAHNDSVVFSGETAVVDVNRLRTALTNLGMRAVSRTTIDDKGNKVTRVWAVIPDVLNAGASE
jgi:hypothetical protein